MRLCRVLLDEHLRVQGRTVRHETVAEMQTALDTFLLCYNREWPHPTAGLQRQIGVGPEPQQEIRLCPSSPKPNHSAKSGHCQIYSVTVQPAPFSLSC